MKFVKLTEYDTKDSIRINMSLVISIVVCLMSSKLYTRLTFIGGESTIVRETPEEIIRLIDLY